MKLNQFVKLARKEKGYSLVAFANEAGITYSMLYRLEDGSISDPHPEILQKVAEPLGVDYRYLMDLAGYLPKEDAPVVTSDIEKEKIPLISWSSIKEVAFLSGDFPSAITDKWVYCEKTGTRTFGVSVPNYSFSPYFGKHNVIIVSQQKKYVSGDFVLTYSKEASVSIKRYRLYDDKPWLISLSERDMPVETKYTAYTGIQIVGKIIEQRYN